MLGELSWRCLAESGPLRGRVGRVQHRLRQVEAAAARNDDELNNSPSDVDIGRGRRGRAVTVPGSARQPLEAQRPACRTQCHVMVGNITRAAHALNSEPLADVNDPIVIAASQTKAP